MTSGTEIKKVGHILLVSLRTLTLESSRRNLVTLGHMWRDLMESGRCPQSPRCSSPGNVSLPWQGTRHESEEAFKVTPAQSLSVCKHISYHKPEMPHWAWSNHRFISKMNGYYIKPLLWGSFLCSKDARTYLILKYSKSINIIICDNIHMWPSRRHLIKLNILIKSS